MVDPGGKPVAGAEVVLTAGPSPDGSVPILSRTATGADGRFRLDRPDPVRLREFLSPGVIWAYRPGQGLGVVDLIRADQSDQGHRLILEPEEVRRLTMLGDDGRPVVGARVAARLVQTERTGYLGATIPDEWLDRLSTATDAHGVAALPGLTRRIDLRSARVDVAGGGAHVVPLRYDDGKLDAAIALGRPARLEGTVKDDSGGPVAGADVEVWVRCGLPLGTGDGGTWSRSGSGRGADRSGPTPEARSGSRPS